MSNVCAGWCIVNDYNDDRKAVVMFCKRWDCPTCQPRRRKQLIARLFSGKPTRWMTLTVNPAVGDGPEHRRKLLAAALNHLAKRIRRKWPAIGFEFAAVCEATKKGEPHLHVAFRGPFIPHAWLSNVMNELIDAPVVDIRWLHSKKQTMSYVCKYVGKKPHQFGTSKRYWFSKNYEDDAWEQIERQPGYVNVWRVVRSPLKTVVSLWQYEGYTLELCRDGVLGTKRC